MIKYIEEVFLIYNSREALPISGILRTVPIGQRIIPMSRELFL